MMSSSKKQEMDYIKSTSRQIAQSINNQLYRSQNDYDDYLKMARAVFFDEEELELFVEELLYLKKNQPLTEYLQEKIRTEIMKNFNRVVKSAKLSRISVMDIEFQKPPIPENWFQWRNIMGEMFNKPPVFGTITGPQGSGKSHCAVWMTESLTTFGYNVASNIKMRICHSQRGSKAITRYRHVSKMSQVMNLWEHGGDNWIVFLDETGIHWSRRDNSSKKNKEMEKFIRLFRKKGLSLILIDQLYHTIPWILKEWETVAIKRYKSHKTIISNELINANLRDISLSFLDFDSRELPTFEVDIDLDSYLGIEHIKGGYKKKGRKKKDGSDEKDKNIDGTQE